MVQDAFTGLWKRQNTLELRYTFATYISSVTRYEVLRRIAGRPVRHEELTDAHQGLATIDPLGEQLDLDDLYQRYQEAVADLPGQCRLVFTLSREEGLSDKDIALELGISVKTVEAHKGKALKALRGKLGAASWLFL